MFKEIVVIVVIVYHVVVLLEWIVNISHIRKKGCQNGKKEEGE